MRRGHLFLLVTIIYALCNSQKISAQDPYVVDVMAMDYAFGMVPKIKSGWVTFRMKNVGKDTHWAMLFEKHDSISLEAFKDSIIQRKVPKTGKLLGGPGMHISGAVSETTILVEPGPHVLVCFATTAEGKNHSELGMMRYIEVTEEKAAVLPPQADATFTLKKYSFEVDGLSKGGKVTWKIIHEDYPMDLQVVKLAPETRMEEVFDFFDNLSDPHPLNLRGGVEQAKKDRVSYLSLELPPGEYLASSQEYGLWGLYKRFLVNDNSKISMTSNHLRNATPLTIRCSDNELQLNNNIHSGPKLISFNSEENDDHRLVLFHKNPDFPSENIPSFLQAIFSGKNVEDPYPQFGYNIALSKGEKQTVHFIPGEYFTFCVIKNESGDFDLHQDAIKVFSVLPPLSSAGGNE